MMSDAAINSGGSPARRRPLACLRCRRRKVRCDGASPACSNCSRAGTECFEGRPESAVSRSRLHYLENRVRELENGSKSRSASTRERNVASLDSTAEPMAFTETHKPDNVSDYNQQPNYAHTALHQQEVGQQSSAIPHQSGSQSQASPGFGIRYERPWLVHEVPRRISLTNDTTISNPAGPSPAGSGASHITRDQPIVHEVGLLSLGNTQDPKYLGPSSGVTFARLIYENVPQSQGLPLSHTRPEDHRSFGLAGHQNGHDDIPQVKLPPRAEYQQYAEAYFAMSTFYPFILQDEFHLLFGQVSQYSHTSTWSCRLPLTVALAQVYLVLSLGARFLEYKLGNGFPSQELFGKAMECVSKMKPYESIEGVQVLLLLAQHSLFCPEGLNAWYLVHTIIASCLDLGLQRRDNGNRENEMASQRRIRHLRSAIFWSAYSMDRSLTVLLGRPLTLRDEAIDREFPGYDGNLEVESGATEWRSSRSDVSGLGAASEPYTAFIYSLRFDRIVAEIKLMLYRVSKSPRRFPWPRDLSEWRLEAQNACIALIEEAQGHQRRNLTSPTSVLSGVTLQRLELKYHQCIMLLNRPSPQNPHPSFEATQASFSSAMGIIATYTELQRFSNMDFSWLTAHSIFVASITVIYCLWTCPAIRGDISLDSSLLRVEQAHHLLNVLGRTWSVALEASRKLERLIKSTNDLFEGLSEPQINSVGLWANDNPGAIGLPDANVNRPATNFVPPDGGNALIDELGILRDLFDLGWLDDFASDNNPSLFTASVE